MILFMVFRTRGIQPRGDGKDCAPLPPKEWGVRWAYLAIFFLDSGLGDDFLHLGTPGTCLRRADAFGQARKKSRKNKLATKLPPGVTHPKVVPGQLLRVETEIYGLVSGPSWLRASLTVDLLAAGYKKKSVRQNDCSHCSLPMKHRKANCCSTLTMS